MITEDWLKEIPLIDTHVHRVHPNRSPLWGNLGGGYVAGPGQEKHARQTILYHMIMEELRKQFKMPDGISLEEVEVERFRRYEKDPKTYFRELTENQNVITYCLEVGSPLGGAPYTEKEINDFNASIPEEKQRNIVRIERAMEAVMKNKKPFAQMIEEYKDYFSSQIVCERAIAIKSCAAYSGGLEIYRIEKNQAQKAYEILIRERKDNIATAKEVSWAEKTLNNYILFETLELAEVYNLPIQFHTGEGGGGYIDFETLNPVKLIHFLKDKQVFNRIKIILLHGGHPYEEMASYLTAQFSHVYSDFSGMFYLCSIKGLERMAALIEKAPLDKVMYGSDGVMFPEFSWFSYIHFCRQLSKLLNSLVKEGFMTEKWAQEVARKIFYENALECYTKLNKKI